MCRAIQASPAVSLASRGSLTAILSSTTFLRWEWSRRRSARPSEKHVARCVGNIDGGVNLNTIERSHAPVDIGGACIYHELGVLDRAVSIHDRLNDREPPSALLSRTFWVFGRDVLDSLGLGDLASDAQGFLLGFLCGSLCCRLRSLTTG